MTLTVTDDQRATGIHDADPHLTNAAPAPSLLSTADGLTASLDSSGSSDPDGSVVAYAWTFGDGCTSTQAKPARTYAGPAPTR